MRTLLPTVVLAALTSPVLGQSNCGIANGQSIRVINTPNCNLCDMGVDGSLNVRTSPGISNPVCTCVCNGHSGTIIDGSVSSGGFTWWKIEWSHPTDCDLSEGWSVESDSTGCLLEVVRGACCLNSLCFPSFTRATCVTLSGAWQGPNSSTCQNCGATGACCLSGGECLGDHTQAECSTQGGVSWNANTSCGSLDCQAPPTDGACCNGTSCSITTSANCTGGWTSGGTCSPNPCQSEDTTPPTVPTGLTATAISPTQINLSWNASTDAQSGVAGYNVYRNGAYLTSRGSTNHQDTTVSPSTQYCYRVSAFNGDGYESSQSGQQCATTPALSPGRLTVSPSEGLVSSGPAGGPFSPVSKDFALTNTGQSTINWNSVASNWLTVSPSAGTLTAGTMVTVTVSINATATINLSLCQDSGSVLFRNTTNGNGDATRTAKLTLTNICNLDAEEPPSDGGGTPPDIRTITMNVNRLLKYDPQLGAFRKYSGGTPINIDKPTFILAHGWDGSPAVWDYTAPPLAQRYPGSNILAWDWSDLANPNNKIDSSLSNFSSELSRWGSMRTKIARVIIKSIQAAADAHIAAIFAGSQGTVLMQALNSYPSIGSEVHLIGKSLGGGLLARTAVKLKNAGRPVDSLTMIDTPRFHPVDAMQYLDPASAERVLVMYYPQFPAACGFGQPAQYPAINLRMNPAFNDGGFCVHVTVTNDGAWFPALIEHGFSVDGEPLFFPEDVAMLQRCKSYGEAKLRDFKPIGACQGSLLSCTETLPDHCVGSPIGGLRYQGDHTLCFVDDTCPDGASLPGGPAQSIAAWTTEPSENNAFPGMLAFATEPFDSASSWTGTQVLLATGVDPADSKNKAVLLQESGEASFFKVIHWPSHAFVAKFDYMFREPRGDENLTVYVGNRIVYYDHAATSLAVGSLTSSGALYLGDAAGSAERLAFVLRTDGIAGGGVVLDNLEVYGFMPGDIDGNATLDLADMAGFQQCRDESPLTPVCAVFDADDNGNLSVADLHILKACMSGPGVSADPNCSALFGACCITEKDCNFTSAEDCAKQGGQYLGAGIACIADLCSAPSGACKNLPSECPQGQSCNPATGNCEDIICTSNADCDDGASCSTDTCQLSTGVCVYTLVDAACDDGLFCTGDAVCEPDSDDAESGTGCVREGNPCESDTPVCVESTDSCRGCESNAECDDGIACTTDSCNGITGQCNNTPHNGLCSNELPGLGNGYCLPDNESADSFGCVYNVQDCACLFSLFDGYSFCEIDATNDTTVAVPVGSRLIFKAATGECSWCFSNADCDDGKACTTSVCNGTNGVCTDIPNDEVCTTGYCDPSEPTSRSDGCVVSSCWPFVKDETGDECAPCTSDAQCHDGIPCTLDACQADGTCGNHPNDSLCQDDVFCNGADLCEPSDPNADADGCVPTGDPCWPEACDEVKQQCGSGACCYGLFGCNETTASDCEAIEGTFKGLGTMCDEFNCDGACCLLDGDCWLTSSEECAALKGEFGGLESDCSFCKGACCDQGGNCYHLLEYWCQVDGDVFHGRGLSCEDVACTGACCTQSGFCWHTSEYNCSGEYDELFLGLGTSCDESSCAAGACCYDDPPDDCSSSPCVCENLRPDLCELRGGDYRGDDTDCDVCYGACCLSDSVCTDRQTEETCQVQYGGTFHGRGSRCADAELPCSGYTGACCSFDWCGDDFSAYDCLWGNGDYRGDGSVCEEQDCSLPFGACGSAGSCCTAGRSAGCEDAECCRAVCLVDPQCCLLSILGGWDAICVEEANLLCGDADGTYCLPCPSEGDCCTAHRGAGCDDATCCRSVCRVDPYCCDVTWDEVCAEGAAMYCSCP